MLTLEGTNFTCGRADFLDNLPAADNDSSRIFLRIEVEGLAEPVLAMLDTGAEWSVIAPEIAAEIGISDLEGQNIRLKHKDGVSPGKLVRTSLRLLADEGEDLLVEATVFVPDGNWPASRSFIGYTGFLDRVRLGLDPQQNHIYFGGY